MKIKFATEEKAEGKVIRASIEIDRTPSDVFAYVEQLDRHGEWQPAILSARKEPAGATRLGTRNIELRKVPGGPQEFVSEIFEYDPPRRIAARGVSLGAHPADDRDHNRTARRRHAVALHDRADARGPRNRQTLRDLRAAFRASERAARYAAPKRDPGVESRMNMKKGEQATGSAASKLIDGRIRELEGWRGETLARMRALILEADPEMTEEWKWGGPVWANDGIICTGESYKNVVKLTFAKGASVPDPAHLFNSSLEGATRRAIDIKEGEKVDPRAFKALIKAAVLLNRQTVKKQ